MWCSKCKTYHVGPCPVPFELPDFTVHKWDLPEHSGPGLGNAPCPFCGGTGYIHEGPGFKYFGSQSFDPATTTLACPHCRGRRAP